MAENYLYKRQSLAAEAIEKAAAILDGINRLNEIKLEVAESGGGFDDGDFVLPANVSFNVPSTLAHLNAWKMNNLVTDVAPNLKTALAATLKGSAVSYEQILLAVRK